MLVAFLSFVFTDLNIFLNSSIFLVLFFQAEVEKLKSELYLLENKYLNTINELQLEVTKLNLQLKQQSSLNSIIVSTFCYSLSKATQTSSAVEMVLQEVII